MQTFSRFFALDPRFLTTIVLTALRDRVFLTLLLLDGLLIALHVITIGFVPPDQLPASARWTRLDGDRSFAEIFEYLKCIGAGALLLKASRGKSPAIAIMALLPFYLMLDNSLRIHEELAELWFPVNENRGELAISIAIGVLLTGVTIWAWVRADRRERAIILAVWASVMLVGFFGGFIDVLHVFAKRADDRLGRLFGILEDGGELIAQSLVVGISLAALKLCKPLSDTRRIAT